MIGYGQYGSKLLAVLLASLLAAAPLAEAQIGYSVQGSGGGTTQSQVVGSGLPNAATDPLAYGKAIFAGTGVRGAYGFIDTISTRSSGPLFRIDNLNYVATLKSDLDANVDIYRSRDGGVSWGTVTTVALAGAGASNGGVASTSASYFGYAQRVVRTVDFVTFSEVDVSSLVGTAVVGAWTKGPTRLHFVGSGTAAPDKHYCRSVASAGLNPTALAHFECQLNPFTGGTGINAGSVFMGGQSITYVPGSTGTLLVVDNPQNSAVANIWRSTDEGTTWTLVANGLTATNRDTVDDPGHGIVCHQTGSPCWATVGTHIYKSTDAGATWAAAYSADATGNLHTPVVFEEEPDIFLAVRSACSGSNQPMGLRTTDGGVTWATVIMERCSVTAGRHATAVHTANGRFVIGQISQTPFLAFQGVLYGTAGTQSNATPTGETRVSSYSNGVKLDALPTYSATITETATSAGLSVFAGMCGSASKIIRIKRVEIPFGSVAVAAQRVNINLSKTSAATSGGTATALTQVPHSSNSAAGTATLVNFYTATATAGTLVGRLGTVSRWLPLTASAAGDFVPPSVWDFTGMDAEPVFLRSTTECIELANVTTTGANAASYSVRFVYTEE